MREVRATEAKTNLSELLSAVEHGESIAITRHGKPVAHLVPAEKQDHATRRAAVERFKTWRATWKGIDVSLEELLSARHEGHRY